MKNSWWRTKAKRQAADDFVRLYGAEDAAGGMPQHWEQKPDEYRRQFKSMQETMADIESLEQDPDILAAVEQRPVKPETTSSSSHGYWPKLAAVACIVLAAVAGLWQMGYFEAKQGVETVRYATRIGEQKNVLLSDGSRLVLNTNTRIVVKMDDEKRVITLNQGEAYFDVSRDQERPFLVSVGKHAVTVLGTEFSILREGGVFTLAVNEGSVALHEEGSDASGAKQLELALEASEIPLGQYVLTAGMQVEYTEIGDRLIARLSDPAEKLFSWTTGMIRFDGDSLSDVVGQLNRFSGRPVVIEDPEIEDLRVYMNIKVSSISDAFTAIEKTLPVEIEKGFDKIELRARK